MEAAVSISAEAGNTNTGKIDWHYDIVDKNLDFLGVGESLTITAPIVIDDHNGGIISQNVVVTINGANDNPIAAADSNGTVQEIDPFSLGSQRRCFRTTPTLMPTTRDICSSAPSMGPRQTSAMRSREPMAR